jgi:DNA-binding Xre family transcriptional regulator
MRWNMRLAAAQRGIWKASDLQRIFAEHGLVISAGKMSGLWSGQPVTIKLADLDVICVALDCQVGDLLIAEPDTVTRPGQTAAGDAAKPAADATTPADIRRVVPRRRDGRSLPPR